MTLTKMRKELTEIRKILGRAGMSYEMLDNGSSTRLPKPENLYLSFGIDRLINPPKMKVVHKPSGLTYEVTVERDWPYKVLVKTGDKLRRLGSGEGAAKMIEREIGEWHENN